ncbi:MAG: hypothetical protein KDA47_20340 [Planctomycetales bacterium]|nr:hypothetical protein [Planctomycetales bacterium]
MMATGRVDASGNYTLYSGVEGRPGAMVGKYKVYLTPDSSGSSYMESGSGGPPQPQKDGPIPAEFTSADTTTKEVDVQAQDNTLDIEL